MKTNKVLLWGHVLTNRSILKSGVEISWCPNRPKWGWNRVFRFIVDFPWFLLLVPVQTVLQVSHEPFGNSAWSSKLTEDKSESCYWFPIIWIPTHFPNVSVRCGKICACHCIRKWSRHYPRLVSHICCSKFGFAMYIFKYRVSHSRSCQLSFHNDKVFPGRTIIFENYKCWSA